MKRKMRHEMPTLGATLKACLHTDGEKQAREPRANRIEDALRTLNGSVGGLEAALKQLDGADAVKVVEPCAVPPPQPRNEFRIWDAIADDIYVEAKRLDEFVQVLRARQKASRRKEVTVIEVVNGVVVGPIMHRVALCFNGREIAVGTVESWEEAITWCQNEWDSRKKDLLAGEAQRLGWTNPEVRYWL